MLKESALVEAFNLKAAIEYNMKNHEAAREAMADAPPRTEEELDPVRACMQTRSKCCSCHIPFMHTARVVPVLRFLCQGGMCGMFLAQFLPQRLLCLKITVVLHMNLPPGTMTLAIMVLPKPVELYSRMLLGLFLI